MATARTNRFMFCSISFAWFGASTMVNCTAGHDRSEFLARNILQCALLLAKSM